MSTQSITALTSRVGDNEFTRPTKARLTMVELRKMSDTRSGFWLLLISGALTVLVTVIAAFVFSDSDATLLNYVAVASVPSTVLLPVVGILLVSSEWSQRTAMVTFALVPERSRVLNAKLLAGVVLAMAAFALVIGVAAITTAIAGSTGGDAWNLNVGLIGQVWVSVAVSMVIGVAFGAMLLSSAPAIVLYFVLPTAFAALGTIPALRGAADWLDQSQTTTPLTDHLMSAHEWAQLGTSLALWMALPMALGFWRVLRSDVG